MAEIINKIDADTVHHPVSAGTIHIHHHHGPDKTNPEPKPVALHPELKLDDLQQAGIWKVDAISRFRYTARGTPVFGREAEMARLRKFLDPEQGHFQWWMLGGPGGSGKSRLALELVLEAKKNNWLAGFLSPEQGSAGRYAFLHQPPPDWPVQPTLLIIDYISGKEKETGDVVAALARRPATGHPLRLLLLEREVGPEVSWWKEFLGSGERLTCIENCRHALPLVLPALSLDWMAQVVRKWPGKKPPETVWLDLLQRLNAGGRPLYAAFLADALRDYFQEETVHWDKIALVNRILDRERERWQLCGIVDEGIHLLLLATLCGGIETAPESQLPPYVEQLIASASSHTNPDFAERCLLLTGHALTTQQTRLFPLEPDLLGELFVLEYLQPTPSIRSDNNKKLRSQIIQTAWQINPLGVFATLTRTAQDFPGHAGLFSLLALPMDHRPQERLLWAMAVVNVILRAASQQIGQAATLLKNLATLAMSHPKEPLLREEQAKGAFNLITFYGNAGQICTGSA
ncbi:MAG: ATP-binding protein [Magnetococcus sp. DMHC-1]